MKHAFVICNGEPPSRVLARRLARNASFIIAADGGANIARAYGIKPHVIVGDLDSATRETLKFFSGSTIVRMGDQYSTDLEKALTFCIKKGIAGATIIAATGRRLDFTLGNLSVIWQYTRRLDIQFVGDDWEAMPVSSGKAISARVGTTVSLIPFGPCNGITLRGLGYPLRNATMRVGEIGVSNVVRRSPFSVRVKRGKLLMVILRPQSRRRSR